MSPVQQFFTRHRQRGFVTITSVAVLLVISTVVVVFVLMAAYQIAVTELAWRDAVQSTWLADACGEYAVAKLQGSVDYTGSQSLQFSEGDCSIFALTATLSQSFEVRTQGTVGEGLGRALWTFIMPEAGTVQVESHTHSSDF